jgi:hypothetical protein
MSIRWLIGSCSAHTWHRRFPHSLVGSALGCGLRSDLALVEQLLRDMRLSKAWRFTRGVWLLAAVVVCLGAFLCFLPTELDVSTALRAADSHPLDRGAHEGYLAVAQEAEAWEEDKAPVNADLLTILVLAVSSLFGLRFGWQLTNPQRQGASCSLGVVGPSLASACEELPFLGVLRL